MRWLPKLFGADGVSRSNCWEQEGPGIPLVGPTTVNVEIDVAHGGTDLNFRLHYNPTHSQQSWISEALAIFDEVILPSPAEL
jgi:hypothetical protein